MIKKGTNPSSRFSYKMRLVIGSFLLLTQLVIQPIPAINSTASAQAGCGMLDDNKKMQFSEWGILVYDPNACACRPVGESSASIGDKLAQTFIIGVDGNKAGFDKMKSLANNLKVGGFYVNGRIDRSVWSKEAIDEVSNNAPMGQLIIASDDEGGAITRFYPENTKSAADLGDMTSPEVYQKGIDVGKTLKERGVNVVLAPVLDINYGNSGNAIANGRSFGGDPNLVAEKAGVWIQGVTEQSVGATMKHFPGIGRNSKNTDFDSQSLNESAEELQNDIAPYRKLAGRDKTMVMLANTRAPNLWENPEYTSINESAISYLRNNVGFTGVITTDDLAAIAKYSGSDAVPLEKSVPKAIKVGVTAPLFAAPSEEELKKIIAITEAESAEQINAAYTKITAFKRSLGLTVKEPSSSTVSSGGTNTNLPQAIVDELDRAGVVDKINNNKARYEHAQSETGVPWQLIAVTHWREAGLNPNKSILNGQDLHDGVNVDGVFSYKDPNKDAVVAAGKIRDNANWAYDVTVGNNMSIEDIGSTFLAYNRGVLYKNAGLDYTKSGYVMRGVDESHLGGDWDYLDPFGGHDKSRILRNANAGALATLMYISNKFGLDMGEGIKTTASNCAPTYSNSATISGDMAFPLITTKSAIGDPESAIIEGHTKQQPGYLAVDLFEKEGTPIVAMQGGSVKYFSNSDTDLGFPVSKITITTTDGAFEYFYTHMALYSPKDAGIVERGQKVDVGQQLGRVGNKDNAFGTPTHLHIDASRVPPGRPSRCSRSSCVGAAEAFVRIVDKLRELYQGLPD